MRGFKLAITALAAMLAIAGAPWEQPRAAGVSHAHSEDDRPLPARRRHRSVGARSGRSSSGANGDNRSSSKTSAAPAAMSGRRRFARANPDGYTLLFASPGPLATNAFMYKTMPYDPAKWVPIAVVATSPYVLVVSPHFDASSLAQVIAQAKAEPRPVNVRDAGRRLARPVRNNRVRNARQRQTAAGSLQGLEPGGDRRARRQRQHDVRHDGDVAAAHIAPARKRSSPWARRRACRNCPTFRRSPRRAFRDIAR